MDEPDIDDRISSRLRSLRVERGWSLDRLAKASGISRATLSRIENGEVGATASGLNRICNAYGLTMSRLMAMVEEDGACLVRRGEQPTWRDEEAGFSRRVVSPPGRGLAGEAIEGVLRAGARIDYHAPPRAGLEHHLVMLDGRLSVALDGESHRLEAGDCLRYRLIGASTFETPAEHGARYLLFMV